MDKYPKLERLNLEAFDSDTTDSSFQLHFWNWFIANKGKILSQNVEIVKQK